ncbi:hypothetical protein PYCC9005_000086 [Savitreella phatthalungensis]
MKPKGFKALAPKQSKAPPTTSTSKVFAARAVSSKDSALPSTSVRDESPTLTLDNRTCLPPHDSVMDAVLGRDGVVASIVVHRNLDGSKSAWTIAASAASATIPISLGKTVTFGRATDADVLLSDVRVSAYHCRIYVVAIDPEYPLVYALDLSRNGTFHALAGTQAAQARIGKGHSVLLTDGDRLEVSGVATIEFRQHRKADLGASLTHERRSEVSLIWHVTRRVLGQGSFGKVLLAYNRHTRAQAACKLVDRALYAHHHADDRREKDILQEIAHPNIIRTLQIVDSPSSIWFFTELMPGGDLFSLLHTPGRPATRPGEGEMHARLIVYQLANALAYLHASGIAHRDLKLENVLLAQPRGDARVVLTDFGAAARFRSVRDGDAVGPAASEMDLRLRMFSQIGTVGNMAPEVVRAGPRTTKTSYGPEVDMWYVHPHITIYYHSTNQVLSQESWMHRLRIAGWPCAVCNLRRDKSFNPIYDLSARVQEWKDAATRPHFEHGGLVPPIEYVSADGPAFVSALLQEQVSKRLTAETALLHPWLARHKAALDAAWRACACDAWNARHQGGNDIGPPLVMRVSPVPRMDEVGAMTPRKRSASIVEASTTITNDDPPVKWRIAGSRHGEPTRRRILIDTDLNTLQSRL